MNTKWIVGAVLAIVVVVGAVVITRDYDNTAKTQAISAQMKADEAAAMKKAADTAAMKKAEEEAAMKKAPAGDAMTHSSPTPAP